MSVIDWQDGVTPVNGANLDTLESIYRKGQANGYASLDAGTKVPVAQLPAGTANGVASLDATGKVPLAQLPDTAGGSYVPLDGVQVAGTRILASKLLAGDAQPAFRIMGDGKHEWGPGGATAPDVNLYRSAVDTLKTDDALISAAPSGNFTALLPDAVSDRSPFRMLIAGEAQPRFRVNQLGTLNWGPGGSTALDTNLYRSAAGTLKTDGALLSGGVFQTTGDSISVRNATDTENRIMLHRGWTGADQPTLALFAAGGTERIRLGSAAGPGATPGMILQGDTNLYRSAAGVLKTDGTLQAVGAVYANYGQANQAHLATDGRLYFGSANDTNLYRSAANSLRTDDNFAVALNCYVEGDLWIKNNVSNWLFITGDDGGGGGFPASFPASIVVNLNGSIYKIPLV